MSDTIYRLKSALGVKFETTNAKRAQQRLAEVKAKDPTARLLTIPANR